MLGSRFLLLLKFALLLNLQFLRGHVDLRGIALD